MRCLIWNYVPRCVTKIGAELCGCIRSIRPSDMAIWLGRSWIVCKRGENPGCDVLFLLAQLSWDFNILVPQPLFAESFPKCRHIIQSTNSPRKYQIYIYSGVGFGSPTTGQCCMQPIKRTLWNRFDLTADKLVDAQTTTREQFPDLQSVFSSYLMLICWENGQVLKTKLCVPSLFNLLGSFLDLYSQPPASI